MECFPASVFRIAIAILECMLYKVAALEAEGMDLVHVGRGATASLPFGCSPHSAQLRAASADSSPILQP